MTDSSPSRESSTRNGGVIPGTAGLPAFALTLREPSSIPILIAVPHAGRQYPAGLVDRMRSPANTVLRLEDRLVDMVAGAIARETGAGLLVAHAPRAMIDLNRAVDEMDWEMLAQGAPPERRGQKIGRRARGGLGLVPRRLPGTGEIWKGRIDEAELAARIDGVHTPYHEAISSCLGALRRRWGAALLIDLHSMPPLAPRGPGEPGAEFVMGDRFGATCDGALCAAAFDELHLQRRRAAHNRPYAGGYVLERHSAPDYGLHALQIEICRSIYLDEWLAEPGERLAETVDTLVALVRRLAGEVAALGRQSQMPQAAE